MTSPIVPRRAGLCALLAVIGLLPTPLRAANPFIEPDPAPATSGRAGPFALPVRADDRMPPGTPSQVAAGFGNGPMGASAVPGAAVMDGQVRPPTAAPRELLDSLGISSIVSDRVIFRLSRGAATAIGAGSGRPSSVRSVCSGTARDDWPASPAGRRGMVG